MRRREFLGVLGGAVAAWPLAARAQQPSAMPMVGFLNGQTAAGFVHLYRRIPGRFGRGWFLPRGATSQLSTAGRMATLQRMRTLAEELIGLHVAVLVATGGVSSRRPRHATASVPIVCTLGSDPIKFGFAETIKRPGGNLTGMSAVIGRSRWPSGWRCSTRPFQAFSSTRIINLTSPTKFTEVSERRAGWAVNSSSLRRSSI